MSPDSEMIGERDDAPVHFRADAPVSDVCVNRIRKIDGSGPGRQALHFAFGGEHIDFFIKGFTRKDSMNSPASFVSDCQSMICRSHWSFSVCASTPLPAAPLLLVHPVGGNAVLGGLMHLVGAESGSPKAYPGAQSSYAAIGTY